MSLQRVVLTCHNHTLSAGSEAGGATVIDNGFSEPDDQGGELINSPGDSHYVSHYLLERVSEKCGGAKGIRTPDLLHAMQTRYQLRHSPATQQDASSEPPRKVERS